MALGINIAGSNTGAGVDATTGGHLLTATETNALSRAAFIGGTRTFQENDQGYYTAVPDIKSIEVDSDFRGRSSLDIILDEERFNYTAQNTGKHSFANTTMTGVFTAGQYTTNGTNITTISTGCLLTTYASFPIAGAQTISVDAEIAFSNQPVTNSFVEWGIGVPGNATLVPTDGIFFRLNGNGLQGIVSANGGELSTGIFTGPNNTGVWAYENNKFYQFILYAAGVEAQFWVNDGVAMYKLGSITVPAGIGRLCLAGSGQYFHKHRITGGAASGALQSILSAYSIRLGGPVTTDTLSSLGNRIYGSYQGLSGGTMGSLANYANSANPAAAVPTNTTAALGTGLGGQFWETDTLAVTTDGIICSYQVPALTTSFAGRRLKITGISLASYVSTSLTGGGYNAQYSLAFGHTNVSLATGEGTGTKAPRRIPIPEFTQLVASGATAPAAVPQSAVYADFSSSPIYVNPGEFVALVKKKVGTAPSAGVISHVVAFRYGWE